MVDTIIWHEGIPDLAAVNAHEQNSLSAHLGIEIVKIDGNMITGSMPVDARTVQPHGRCFARSAWADDPGLGHSHHR